jgi:hypothetical protein
MEPHVNENTSSLDGNDVAAGILSVYLNDHRAGSTAALEILDRLESLNSGEGWLRRVRDEIIADREELEHLMRSAGVGLSHARAAFAWLTERMAELKTRLEDRAGGALQRLELLEALALGIHGKENLWTALQAASAHQPVLRGIDYERLIIRAREQRAFVEVQRLRAATDALTDA